MTMFHSGLCSLCLPTEIWMHPEFPKSSLLGPCEGTITPHQPSTSHPHAPKMVGQDISHYAPQGSSYWSTGYTASGSYTASSASSHRPLPSIWLKQTLGEGQVPRWAGFCGSLSRNEPPVDAGNWVRKILENHQPEPSSQAACVPVILHNADCQLQGEVKIFLSTTYPRR